MASFLDIAPLAETVTVRGKDFEVRGLALEDLANTIYRFPQLRGLLPAAVRPGAEEPALDVKSILGLGPEICAALIACATGKAGDPAEEAAIAKLGIAELFAFIEAILRLSFPGGLTPFVERLTALMGGPGAAGESLGRALGLSSSLPSTS